MKGKEMGENKTREDKKRIENKVIQVFSHIRYVCSQEAIISQLFSMGKGNTGR